MSNTGRLGAHAYGKTGVRLAKIERGADGHTFHDLTIKLWLTGDFSPAFLVGDNSTSLPTDSMRATVFGLAADMTVAEPEVFLTAVADRLLSVVPAATAAHTEAVIHSWDRITVDGAPHPHSFRGVVGSGTASVSAHRDGPTEIGSGLTDLLVAKTAGSAYSGFLVDEFTFLPETDDRIMATSVDASWAWNAPPASYADARATAREVIETVFATHDSLGVQHTLYATGEALLAAVPDMGSVSLKMPNRHHVPVDVTPYGRENANEVFVVTDRPYGVIEATIERAG